MRSFLAVTLALALLTMLTPGCRDGQAPRDQPVGSAPSAASSSAPAPVAFAPPSASAPAPRSALSDRDFGRLAAALSEPAGKFPSDNFVSNETSWAHVLPALDDPSLRGGAYVGVGPEQSFSYLAILQPELSVLIDIRRQNTLEHLLYKTLFERSATRAEFLAGLCSRKLGPDRPAVDASIEQLSGWVTKLPRGEALALTTAVLERAEALGMPLDKDDRAHLDATVAAFADKCMELRYSMEGSARRYPGLGELMATRDGAGKQRSFLGTDEAFRAVAQLERENRIIPVTGDLAGDGAMPRIAEELRRRGLPLHVLYASNVEQYLFSPATTWKRWVRNVAAMPWAPEGKLLRVYFDQGRKHPLEQEGHRTVSMLVPEASFVARAQGAKPYGSWWEVATVVP